jgi:purine-binding chemotaxis protein CheW
VKIKMSQETVSTELKQEYIDMQGHDVEFEDTQKDKYLTFVVDGDEYGIEIYSILEIIGLEEVTNVPKTPDFVTGIINLRGSIIPVLEIRARFRKPAAQYTDRACIVVAQYKDITIGLIVDAVKEVMSIPQEYIQPPPKATSGYHNKFIKNIGKIGENAKLLLDLDKLLNDED